MDRKAKPIPKTGERNVYCPHYGGCLDYAIDHSWESWNCSVCEHKMAHQSFGEWDYEITDPLPYYDLPPIIAESILKDSFE
jgi:hypothetical protein